MITWFQVFPIYGICIFPWIIAGLPVVGSFNFGGMFRQYLANFFMGLLPIERASEYRHFFINGDTLDEYIAVIPVLVALVVPLMWLAFFMGSLGIKVQNFFALKSQQSAIAAYRK